MSVRVGKAAVHVAAALLLLSCGREAQRERETGTLAGEHAALEAPALGGLPPSQFLLAPDHFDAADAPRCVPARAAEFLLPGDEVFGVLLEGRARAYPVTMLSYHHVVNDRLGATPIAVTY